MLAKGATYRSSSASLVTLRRPAQAQDVPFSAAARAVLEGADAVALQLGLKFISTDAVVIALVDRAKRPDAIVDFLAKCAALDQSACARGVLRCAQAKRRRPTSTCLSATCGPVCEDQQHVCVAVF